MRLTIIPSDNFVSVDGDGSHQPLDLSVCGIPPEVHALQWYENRGWIEFDDPADPFAPKHPNEDIYLLPEWALNCVEVWESWKPLLPPEQISPEPVNPIL